MKDREIKRSSRQKRELTEKQIFPAFESQKEHPKFQDIFEVLYNMQRTIEKFDSHLDSGVEVIKFKKVLFSYYENPECPVNKKNVKGLYILLTKKKENGGITQLELNIFYNIKLVAHQTKTLGIEKMTKADLNQFKEYLLAKQYLTFYDLKTLSNHIIQYDKITINKFLKQIFPIKNITLRNSEIKIMTYLFTNLVTKYAYLQDWKSVNEYIVYAHEYWRFEWNYYLELKLKYYEYLSQYFVGPEETKAYYLKKAMNLLETIKDIGDTKTYRKLSTKLDILIERKGINIEDPKWYEIILTMDPS